MESRMVKVIMKLVFGRTAARYLAAGGAERKLYATTQDNQVAESQWIIPDPGDWPSPPKSALSDDDAAALLCSTTATDALRDLTVSYAVQPINHALLGGA